MRTKRSEITVDCVLNDYLGGKSVVKMAKEKRCSRHTIKKRLESAHKIAVESGQIGVVKRINERLKEDDIKRRKYSKYSLPQDQMEDLYMYFYPRVSEELHKIREGKGKESFHDMILNVYAFADDMYDITFQEDANRNVLGKSNFKKLVKDCCIDFGFSVYRNPNNPKVLEWGG